ncbi:MAG TPA: hypothetical protein GXZ48_05250 [Acholeplasmataceae bacterium]|nr:hypothetical protein [Acholeplasmataceae bacterium]
MYNKLKEKFVLKTITSLSFLVLGFYNYINNHEAIFIFLGLLFGFCGDIVLGLKERFSKNLCIMLGIIFFFIGHLFYLIVVIKGLKENFLYSLLFTFLLSIIFIYFFNKKKYNFSKLKPFCYLYLLISLLLFSFSLGNVVNKIDTFKIVIALGVTFFVLSDLLLCHLYFKKQNNTIKLFNIFLYYSAQILIALSIFWY